MVKAATFIQDRAIENFSAVDEHFGQDVQDMIAELRRDGSLKGRRVARATKDDDSDGDLVVVDKPKKEEERKKSFDGSNCSLN